MAAAAPAASTTSPPPVSSTRRSPRRGLFGGPTAVPSGFPDQPANYEISPQQALRVADQDPKVLARKAELTSSDRLTASLSAEAVDVWEVGYYLNDEKVNLVIVDGETGVATESWTGPQVTWPMARGYRGQFGHVLNAPVRLDPARADLPARPLRLPSLAADGPTSTCSSCSPSGSGRPTSTPPTSASSVPLLLPAARVPARPHALDRAPGARAATAGRGRVTPDDAGLADDRRCDRPDRAAAWPATSPTPVSSTSATRG